MLLACKHGLIRLLACLKKNDSPKLFVFVLLTFESMSDFRTCKCQSIKYIILSVSCTKIHRKLTTALKFLFFSYFLVEFEIKYEKCFQNPLVNMDFVFSTNLKLMTHGGQITLPLVVDIALCILLPK